MAIFGLNGLFGAALYFGAIGAVYGMRNSGFKNADELTTSWNINLRKGVAGQTDPAQRKRGIAQARAERARTLAQTLKGTGKEIPEGYGKTEWIR